jgi:hypothetical protein
VQLSNYTPGFVVSYDAVKRLARVRVPGLTDGADTFPEAMLCYPLGDKSEHTDIRILAGDRVWLDFVNGDPRFPIIVGFRPKETDNAMNWRRLHHQNTELQADTDIHLFATGGKVHVLSNGQTLVEANEVVLRAGTIKLEGNTEVIGNLAVSGTMTNAGTNVGRLHTHVAPSGGGTTTPPT